MEQNHRLLKIIVVGASVIAIVGVIGFIVSTKSSLAPTNNDVMMEKDAMEKATPESAATTTSLNTVTSSSALDSDFDAYLSSDNDVSDPNDFNDSYSDLNQ